jgi:hypothetical protein
MPALAELPMISVVHPAYHCRPNGGQGSFWPSASLRLSCVRVLATVDVLESRGAQLTGNPFARQRTFGRVCDGCSDACVSD